MLDIQSIDVNISATPILRGVTLEVPPGSMQVDWRWEDDIYAGCDGNPSIKNGCY